MDYRDILSLREDEEHARRGYRFEQAMREILPWSNRPPIALSAATEQLDAFFEWNGWHFLVESKAKREKILAGSHDWEDFELKLRNRKGIYGIFVPCGKWTIRSMIK